MSFDDGAGTEFTEYLVQWYPSDSPDSSRNFRTREAAEQFYAAKLDAGHAPTMLERTVSEWSMTKSSALPGLGI